MVRLEDSDLLKEIRDALWRIEEKLGITVRPDQKTGDPLCLYYKRPVLRRFEDKERWAVTVVQQLLTLHVDGYFGSNTEAAVRGFQVGVGLRPDGIVGRDTWRALERSRHNRLNTGDCK